MVEQFGHRHQPISVHRPYSSASGGVKGWFAAAGQAVMDFIYPAQCPSCRVEIEIANGVCPDCWRDISFLASELCRFCAAPLDGALGPDGVCDACMHHPPAWNRGAAAVLYEGVGRKLVLALKHGDRLDIAPLAASWMLRAGGDLVDEANLIAPAPMHWRRLARRRFNQAGELARALAKEVEAPHAFAPDLLRRTRATSTQDGKTRAERMENVSGVFSITPAWRASIPGAKILLVDDVMTTGATLSECAEICRAAGAAEVNVLVMARVARGDWPT